MDKFNVGVLVTIFDVKHRKHYSHRFAFDWVVFLHLTCLHHPSPKPCFLVTTCLVLALESTSLSNCIFHHNTDLSTKWEHLLCIKSGNSSQRTLPCFVTVPPSIGIKFMYYFLTSRSEMSLTSPHDYFLAVTYSFILISIKQKFKETLWDSIPICCL